MENQWNIIANPLEKVLLDTVYKVPLPPLFYEIKLFLISYSIIHSCSDYSDNTLFLRFFEGKYEMIPVVNATSVSKEKTDLHSRK